MARAWATRCSSASQRLLHLVEEELVGGPEFDAEPLVEDLDDPREVLLLLLRLLALGPSRSPASSPTPWSGVIEPSLVFSRRRWVSSTSAPEIEPSAADPTARAASKARDVEVEGLEADVAEVDDLRQERVRADVAVERVADLVLLLLGLRA